jgi:group I intron endonuclease
MLIKFNSRNESGIYKIVNMITGKYYVGSTINFRMRWKKHFEDLSKNKHHCKKLQHSVNKWGIENFKTFIIEWCPKELLAEREQYYMNYYNVCKDGYNIFPFARSSRGRIVSEKERKEQSERLKGRVISEKTKQAVAEANRTRIWSDESKAKLKAAKFEFRKGIPKSEEQKAKMRKPKSEEHKAKLRKPKSEEHKQKLKEAWLLRKQKSPTGNGFGY